MPAFFFLTLKVHTNFRLTIKVKKTGFITYWGQSRECPNNKLHLVKIFKYQRPGEQKESKK